MSGNSDPLLGEIRELTGAVANLMINEISDWRIICQDQTPTLPA